MNQIVWLILFLVLLVVELSTISLVSIWFAIASLVSFITSYFTSVLWIQLLVFILVSTLSLIFTKKIVKKVTSKEVIKTNLDRVVDSIGVVTEDIKEMLYVLSGSSTNFSVINFVMALSLVLITGNEGLCSRYIYDLPSAALGTLGEESNTVRMDHLLLPFSVTCSYSSNAAMSSKLSFNM